MKIEIDQDDFSLSSIVWGGQGVICGNQVDVTVRNFGDLYAWVVKVETALWWSSAKSGLTRSFKMAAEELGAAVREILEVEES